jgi:hypothetical protein
VIGVATQVVRSIACIAPDIQSVEFEPINSPLDQNPKYGDPNPNINKDGLRIFPDKIDPFDVINRAKVRVRATVFPAQAGVKVNFKTFDMDDPSFDVAPVDSNGNLGHDNRGKVTTLQPNPTTGLTPTSYTGQLTCPSGTPIGSTSCLETAVDKGYAMTDSNGVARMELEVTRQPGDNFAVAVSKNSSYLASSQPLGADLKNIEQVIPISGFGTPTATPLNPAMRTQMLTAWRKLHIEVDDMGVVPSNEATGNSNKETGTITSANSLGAGAVELRLNKVFEERRFQPGTLVVDGVNYNVIDHFNSQGIDYVTIQTNTSASNFTGKNFTIYDDDDFNNNRQNGGPLGDIGENVTPLSDTLSRIQQSDNPNQNIFASTYIMPIQDGGGDPSFNDNDIFFSLNNPGTAGFDVTGQINLGIQSLNNESDNFWGVYIQIAYQGEPSRSYDPNFALSEIDTDVAGQTPSLGDTDSVSNSLGVPAGGEGSLIFIETLSDYFRNRGGSERGLVTAHEIGHQFGIKGDGTNDGVMRGSIVNVPLGDERFVPEHINIMRWRVKSPGK